LFGKWRQLLAADTVSAAANDSQFHRPKSGDMRGSKWKSALPTVGTVVPDGPPLEKQVP